MTAAFDLTSHHCVQREVNGKVGCGPNTDDEVAADEASIDFDDTDGAYQVSEPDPFAAEPKPSIGRGSLRAEITSAPPRPIAGLTRPNLPGLTVLPALASVLPNGLQRGSTLAVTSSVSLLLALLAQPSAEGAWIALVGMPAISADAITEAGIDLSRFAVINPAEGHWQSASWATAVGALLDAVDIVVARPGSTSDYRGAGLSSMAGQQIRDSDARRLNARARSKEAVLMLFGQRATTWPSVQLTLSAEHGRWSGISVGHGRITARQLVVSASGRTGTGRPRTAELWLPARPQPADASAPRPTTELLSELYAAG